MKPFIVVVPPGKEILTENPNLFIRFKGELKQEGTHKLKEGVLIDFCLNPENDEAYQIEVHLRLGNYGTSFLMRELFIPTEHLFQEICLPVCSLLQNEPLENILLRTYSSHMENIQCLLNTSVKITTTDSTLHLELSIGTYESSDILPTDEGLTDEALKKLFQKI